MDKANYKKVTNNSQLNIGIPTLYNIGIYAHAQCVLCIYKGKQ